MHSLVYAGAMVQLPYGTCAKIKTIVLEFGCFFCVCVWGGVCVGCVCVCVKFKVKSVYSPWYSKFKL